LNNWQRKRISKIVVEKLFGTVTEKKIAILGFSFKSNTNDTRESSALYIANDLMENGANVFIHDPKVSDFEIENAFRNFKYSKNDLSSWTSCENIIEAINMADAVIILTEWNEYKSIDWAKIAKLMRKPGWVFDTRNITNDLNSIKKKWYKFLEFGLWG
jgi:UDPglucose 6-dehydrogenase